MRAYAHEDYAAAAQQLAELVIDDKDRNDLRFYLGIARLGAHPTTARILASVETSSAFGIK